MSVIENSFGWDADKHEVPLLVPGRGRWKKTGHLSLSPATDMLTGRVQGLYVAMPEGNVYLALSPTGIKHLMRECGRYLQVIEREQAPGAIFPLQHPERKLEIARR